MCVDMLTKESAAILAFMPYYSGAATVRIENSTQLKIRYQQGRYETARSVLRAVARAVGWSLTRSVVT